MIPNQSDILITEADAMEESLIEIIHMELREYIS